LARQRARAILLAPIQPQSCATSENRRFLGEQGTFDIADPIMDYITPEDKAKLQQQLQECINKRRILSERIGTARALGDLRENADYHAAKEDQGLNEAKIRQLEARLASAVVADGNSMPRDMVFLGATIKLRDVESQSEEVYKLVGQSTGDFASDFVEVTPTSPMGQALMKARVGEVVKVSLRRGERRFEIVEIL
jgi:transcription elongation factor GreA